MAVDTYIVSADADDWYIKDADPPTTGTNTLYASYVNTVSPSYYNMGYADVDTSGIPDSDPITAANVKIDEAAYTSSRGVTKTYHVQIWNGSSFVVCTNGNLTFGASAADRTFALTATEITYISKTAKTSFRVYVDDPAGALFRDFQFYAREFSFGLDAIRLEITHGAAIIDIIGYGGVIPFER